MVYSKSDSVQRSAWARYSVAIGSVLLAWLAREAITPSIGPTALPLTLFFPAVAMAAWYGGVRPGVLAMILSALSANWFFMAPIPGWAIHTWLDAATMFVFVFSSAFIIGAIEAMHRARARALADAS